VDPTGLLPHLIAGLNGACSGLLVWALLAIRRGDRDRHRRIMLANLGVCFVFLVAYLTQVALVGHKRFPGDDWVRTLFLGILTSHTLLAVSLLPLVPRTVYLALRGRFAEHRRIARFTYPIWLYVAVTGVVVYWMNNHLRPPA
jgi:uncharacterized membrane protein YozB (DUF420 family)